MGRSSPWASIPTVPRLPWQRQRTTSGAALWDKASQSAYHATQVAQSGAIRYGLGEHWLILGMTGAGKTTFTSLLTKHIIRDYGIPQSILDSKPAKEFDGYPGLIRSEDPPKLADSGQQVWRPPHLTFAILDAYFGAILADGRPRIVWVNEVGTITKGEQNPTAPDKFNDLAQMAREFGITLIVETQKLAKIPAAAKQQATHVVRFRLSPAAAYDQRIGNRLVGLPPDAPEPRARYGFKYRRIDGDEPCRYYSSHSDFF